MATFDAHQRGVVRGPGTPSLRTGARGRRVPGRVTFVGPQPNPRIQHAADMPTDSLSAIYDRKIAHMDAFLAAYANGVASRTASED
jgi:hypothetical protein